jgi:hypothetical protein
MVRKPMLSVYFKVVLKFVYYETSEMFNNNPGVFTDSCLIFSKHITVTGSVLDIKCIFHLNFIQYTFHSNKYLVSHN